MMGRKIITPSRIEQPTLPGILKGVDLTTHKTLRLAVSGDVALTRLETRVIDTADYQRLRTIRQLGTSHLVYPTALHTRFDHSLGTLTMADRMMRAIRDNYQAADSEREISIEEELLARLLALLHDISHVPFGHMIEDECSIFQRHDQNRGRLERFLGEDSTIGRILIGSIGQELYGRLKGLMLAEMGQAPQPEDDRFILDLVTDTVCADMLDYLRRDAFFCNISVDSDYRFLRHLALSRQGRSRRMVIRLWKDGKASPRRDVLNELIRLLDNRYLMGERVYFHHAKLVTGTMLAGAVVRASQSGELKAEDLYEMGDDVLLWKLSHSADPAARRLALSLGRRELWKMMYERGRGYVQAEQQSLRSVDLVRELMGRFHSDAPGRMTAEDRIAELLGTERGDFLIHCPHYKMAMKPADVMVFWNGKLQPLKDCSDDEMVGTKLQSILDSHANLWAIRAFLNPKRLALRDTVAEACDMLFSFEPSRRRRSVQGFFSDIIERTAHEAGLAVGLTHDGFEAGRQKALATITALEETERTPQAVHEAVRKAFTKD